MALVSVGSLLRLRLQLPDGNASRFPRAVVYDQSGVQVTGSPFNLTHIGNGLYGSDAYTVLAGNDRLFSIYIVYSDSGHTTEAIFYGRAVEEFDVETRVETVNAKVGTPVGTLASDLASIQADTDDIQSKIGTPVSTVSADIAAIQTKLGTPAGASVSADIASVKSDSSTLVSRLTATRASNLDNLDATVSSRSTATQVSNLDTKIGTPVGTVSSDIATINTKIGTPVGTVSSDIAGVQTKLGTPANGTVSLDIAAVKSDSSAIKTKTDQLSFTGGRVDSVISSTQEDAIVNKVWEEPVADHTTIGTMGGQMDLLTDIDTEVDTLFTRITAQRAANLDNLDAPVSLQSTAAQVSAIDTKLGTPAGVSVSADIASVKSDTSAVESRLTPTRASNIDNLDATVSSRATATQVTNLDTKIGTPAGVSVSADIAAVKSDTNTTNSRLTPTRAANLDNLDATVSSRATGSAVAAVQADTDDIQSKIGIPTSTLATDLAAVRSTQGTPANGTISADIASVKSDSAAIKAKTDQIGFTSGRVNAQLSTVQESSIADAVWDEDLSTHAIAGSAGKKLNDLSMASTPAGIAEAVWNHILTTGMTANSSGQLLYDMFYSVNLPNIADSVWDELVSTHNVPGTFGLFMDVIRQYSSDNNAELVSGTTGLAAIKAEVLNNRTALKAEIDANEVKIDAIVPAVNAAKAAVIAEVDQNEVKIDSLASQMTTDKAQIIAEVNANEVKIDTLTSQVGTIQNNTTTRFIVPEQIYRPDIGSKTYEFHLRLYDTSGNPEAPDTAPTIRIRRLDTATDIVVGAVMTQLGVNVGAYYYQFTITSGTALYQMLVEATVVEGGITRLVPAVTEIVEFQSDLNAIQSAVAVLDTKTSDVQNKVNNPIYGLSALQTGQTGIISEINQNEAKIDLVKAKTDNLPADPASSTDVAAVSATVLTRPDLASIVTQLNIIRDAIRGADGRTNTDVYDKIDFSNIAKTNDPRFNYLDTNISSRSTLVAADVWAYATRTLSSVVLPPSEVQKIWDALTTSFGTAGSVGKLLKDYLDAAVSSRATQAQVTSLLSGVAQESTVLTETAQIDSSLTAMNLVLTTLQNLVTLVKSKTDNLPADPAKETTLQSETTQIDIALSAIALSLGLVKSKTDNLPIDPAKETSVIARPTNPVLDNDVRLARLDANVSSRSTLQVSDLSFLVSDAEMTTIQNLILSAITSVYNLVANVDNSLSLRPTSAQMDTKLVPVAKTTDVSAAESNILDAIAGIPGGGGGATPAQIWSHPSRTLTASPTDISGLATSAEVATLAKTQYTNRMSTVYNNITGDQELIAWAEKDGQRVSGTNCVVTVKTAAGVVKWTATQATPNADGVFRFVNPLSATADSNYYVVIEITVDAAVRTTQQPFFTVG